MGIPILAFSVSPQNMDMRYGKSFAGVSVVLVSALLIAPMVKKEKDPCRVELGVPHISTHLAERKGLTAVKVNAFSICDKPHARVSLTVELWKEETIFKKRIRKSVARHQEMLRPNEKFFNEKTYVPCKFGAETLYFAKAFGKALIDGVWHFAANKSEVSIPVKCGT